VNRGPGEGPGIPGAIISINNAITNAAALNIEGWDMRLTYELDTDYGQLFVRSEYSHLESYTFQGSPEDPSSEFMGEGGYPEDRFNASLRFTRDNFTANYTFNHIAEHGDGELQDYDDYTTHDITLEYRTPVDGLTLTVGALNFTDEKPVLDSIGGYDDGITGVLYDLAGRRMFGSIRYSF
jgi:outer membrane receptor protein involved in Fe transport